MAGWGAFKAAKEKNLNSKGLLIADAGTVLSLTKITANGEFAGGQLMAGLNLQISAMAKFAANLNKPESHVIISEIFPFSTDEAMLRGSLQALIGNLVEAQKETNLPIWICGGDSEILYKYLHKRLDIIYRPNIVLETMINLKF